MNILTAPTRLNSTAKIEVEPTETRVLQAPIAELGAIWEHVTNHFSLLLFEQFIGTLLSYPMLLIIAIALASDIDNIVAEDDIQLLEKRKDFVYHRLRESKEE
uniref:Uncharacterized protein n=1 Tax=Glossina pallidipes TaxID=7398 RepID=A0A1A9ZH34_GLOPL